MIVQENGLGGICEQFIFPNAWCAARKEVRCSSVILRREKELSVVLWAKFSILLQ